MKPQSIAERSPFSLAVRFAVLLALLAAMLPLQAMVAEALTATVSGTNVSADVRGVVRDGDGTSIVFAPAGEFELTFPNSDTATAFCVDANNGLDQSNPYSQVSWEESGINQLAEVSWILSNYTPSTKGGPSLAGVSLQGTDAQKAAAVQTAIWSFTDEFEFQDSSSFTNNSTVVSNHGLILDAVPDDSLTLPGEPTQASVEIQSPATTEGIRGGPPIGPFTVTANTGEVTFEGPVVDVGGTPLTSPLPLTDGQATFYIGTETAGPVSFNVSGDVTVTVGQVFDIPDADSPVQRIILADTVTTTDSDPVTASVEIGRAHV